MDYLNQLYNSLYGHDPERTTALSSAGSGRRYFRLYGDPSVIATIGESRKENEAFIYFSRLFSDRGLTVPHILAVSEDRMSYLQSDLGDTSLYSLIRAHGVEHAVVDDMFVELMRVLPRFHFGYTVDASKCFPRGAMDKRAAMWDLNYFKYSFLKLCGLPFDEDRLEDDFETLAAFASENPDSTLILRDFQSRNVMVCDGRPYVIDFQGARMGDGLYDLAASLWQARAGLSKSQRMKYAAVYRDAAESLIGHEIIGFDRRLAVMVLFRTLQVLGAYGFRGLFERKAMFLECIPAAVANLSEAVEMVESACGGDFTPYLLDLLRRVAQSPDFSPAAPRNSLIVKVMSFSYKRGIPEDMTGNGGGFVFDCRGMHNPGRYDEYKPLTGREKPVIDFLEQRGEIQQFLDHCYALVDSSVECYLRRGFSDLMVCFGCTGGRHRSVYCAEHMAGHLSDRFGVEVTLIHREQSITEKFEAR